LELARWARGKQIDLAVSHNSYSQILAARALSLRCVTLMDYEHQPANHLAFRLASRVIVPRTFPETSLMRFGATAGKAKRYDGIKEEVYLANFVADPNFEVEMQALGIDAADILVTARPPASEALYQSASKTTCLISSSIVVLQMLAVRLVLLPRNEWQRQYYARDQIIIPAQPIDGPNLIAYSDLVVSAGGTMNREGRSARRTCGYNLPGGMGRDRPAACKRRQITTDRQRDRRARLEDSEEISQHPCLECRRIGSSGESNTRRLIFCYPSRAKQGLNYRVRISEWHKLP